MRKKILCTLFVILVCIFSVFGYVFGDSNLSFRAYPEFSEYAPSKPYTSYDESYNEVVSQYDYERYKREVEKYVENAKEYIENGNNDIRRIQEAQSETIDKINDVVDEFNSWARTVKVSSSYY